MSVQNTRYFTQDLDKRVDLRQGGSISNADNEGVVIYVGLYHGKEEAPVSGSVVGAVVCPDGSTVSLQGSFSGNTVSVALNADCVAIPGEIGLGIQVIDSSAEIKATVFRCSFTVDIVETNHPVDPGSRAALHVADLVAAIDRAIASIPPEYDELAQEVSDLKSAIDPVAFDELAFYTPNNKTQAGVTFTVNSDKSIGVSGSSTGTAFIPYFSSPNTLPDFLAPGDTFYLRYSSENVYFEIFPYVNGVLGSAILSVKSNASITIPSDVTGLIIRLGVRRNTTVNETVRPYFTKLETVESKVPYYEKNKGTAPSALTSCDDVNENCVIFISTGGGVLTVPDFPVGSPGWLKTVVIGNGSSSSIALQLAYPYTTSKNIFMRRRDNTGTWGVWRELVAGQTPVTYNITQNINSDTYANTYNSTISPQITTDSHGWLAAVDTASTPQANATDMTPAIMAMLNATGYCHLGEGVFFVSGNINMPANSTLEGCGNSTVVQLLDSVQSGYIVQPGGKCTIRDIWFKGATSQPSDLQNYNADHGSRHGVYAVANGDGQTSYEFVTGFGNHVRNCRFSNFDGSAIYASNLGGSVRGQISAAHIDITGSKVGINLDYYVEYNKFVDVKTYQCNIACINNGGNNVFVGCTFHGVVGFVMDNSNSDKSNNGHGTCSACTFNHIDNVNKSSTLGCGNAIEMRGIQNGFLFESCQFWYGEILVENSRGASFNGCLFGGGTPTVIVRGDYPAFLNSCIFHAEPSFDVNSSTKIVNCCLDSDGSVISVQP